MVLLLQRILLKNHANNLVNFFYLQQIIVNHDRRMSAPGSVATNSRPAQQQPILQHGSSYNVSDPSSVNSTRNTSPVSLISSSASSASTTSVIEPQRRNSERLV